MNRFLSFLSTIAHGFGQAEPFIFKLAPYLSLIPTVGPIFVTFLGAVASVQNLVPNDNAAKKAVATAIVNANHPGLEPSAVSAGIDQMVAALKAPGTGDVTQVLDTLQKAIPTPQGGSISLGPVPAPPIPPAE